MYPIPVQDFPFNSFYVGRKTVSSAGTPERLVAKSTPIRYVILQALSTNSGLTYWGYDATSAKSNAGMELFAGASIVLPIDDAYKIFLDVGTNGDGVCFFYPKNE